MSNLHPSVSRRRARRPATPPGPLRRHAPLPLLVLLCALGACTDEGHSTSDSATLSVVDDAGRTVALTEPARRIVACSPDAAEVVAALDAELLVGRSSYADHPPAILELPVVGDFSHPDPELIAALQPDLVILAGLEQAPLLAKLDTLSLTAYVHQPAELAELVESFRRLGVLLDRRETATASAAELERTLAEVASRRPAVAPRVYLEISAEPLMAACQGSLQHDLLTAVGAVNVFAELPRAYHRVEPEAVLAAAPEIILLLDGATTPADVESRRGWSALPAVRRGRVYSLEPDLHTRAGPRIVAALEDLSAIVNDCKNGRTP